jgi:plasmid stabilization system protein ParE
LDGICQEKLREIFEYYYFKTGNSRLAENLVWKIVDSTIDLEKNPDKGQLELTLSERPNGFRYLVSGNYKIIYWIDHSKNRIDISHVFDTRQNPDKLQELE